MFDKVVFNVSTEMVSYLRKGRHYRRGRPRTGALPQSRIGRSHMKCLGLPLQGD